MEDSLGKILEEMRKEAKAARNFGMDALAVQYGAVYHTESNQCGRPPHNEWADRIEKLMGERVALYWTCGCGWHNGPNLSNCSQCGRPPHDDPDYGPNICTYTYAAPPSSQALVDALEQALDDMGDEGHSVCEATKQLMREALKGKPLAALKEKP